jgi:hypothetical protein
VDLGTFSAPHHSREAKRPLIGKLTWKFNFTLWSSFLDVFGHTRKFTQGKYVALDCKKKC